MTTSTPTRRVVEPAGAPPRIQLPDQWLRGLLAGGEAAVLSWLVVAVPAIATYVATASAPELGSAGWLEAARVGTAAWLLGHGAAITLGELTITLMPLGITLVALGVLAASVRRAHLGSWASGGFAAAGYLLLTTAFVAFAATPGGVQGLLGAVGVTVCGVAIGLRGAPAPAWWAKTTAKIPGWVSDAVALAWRLVLVQVALATVATVWMIVANLGAITELHDQLGPDAVSAVVLVLAQLLVLPNLVLWAGAYLLGSGFAVGADTVFSPSVIEAGPLPLVPVLGALPEPDGLLGQLPVLGLVGLLSGLVAGVWLARRMRGRGAVSMLAAVAGAAALAGLVLAGFTALAAGGVGPGRMATMGGDWLAVGVAMAWQAAAAAGVVIVLAHPITAAGARRLRAAAGVWWEQVTGTKKSGDGH
ncbi:DUF6350 family protein [Ruania albidiflava]|uniref:cell division protein PerM n=1 Tax=Ruania albidiflava TaxID=366586 RepID=UPI0003B4921A|nr:DUF6350 family protein [Ruania albidiflava]